MSQPADWNSKLYEAKHAFVWKAADSLLELLDARPGERILDLGCGTGHLTERIASAGAEVTGLDHSQTMLEQARTTFPQPFPSLRDRTNPNSRYASAIAKNDAWIPMVFSTRVPSTSSKRRLVDE